MCLAIQEYLQLLEICLEEMVLPLGYFERSAQLHQSLVPLSLTKELAAPLADEGFVAEALQHFWKVCRCILRARSRGRRTSNFSAQDHP